SLPTNGTNDICSCQRTLLILSPEPNHGSLMNLSPVGSPREHSCLRNKKESCSMQAQRLSARIGAILSLLGGALVIFGVFFLPMVFGYGGGSATPHTELDVGNDSSLVGVVL